MLNIFAVVLLVKLQQFSEDSNILAGLLRLSAGKNWPGDGNGMRVPCSAGGDVFRLYAYRGAVTSGAEAEYGDPVMFFGAFVLSLGGENGEYDVVDPTRPPNANIIYATGSNTSRQPLLFSCGARARKVRRYPPRLTARLAHTAYGPTATRTSGTATPLHRSN